MMNKISIIISIASIGLFAATFDRVKFDQQIEVNSIDAINGRITHTNGLVAIQSDKGDIPQERIESVNGITFEVQDDGDINFKFVDDGKWYNGKTPIDRIMINGNTLGNTINQLIDIKLAQTSPLSISNTIQEMVYNPLWGKKLAVIGDSLTVTPTVETSWSANIARRNNMILVNKGRSGERLCVDRTNELGQVTNISTIKSYTNDIPSDADFILCQIGTNDAGDWWKRDEPLDIPDSDMTTNTFKGCFNNLILGIRKNYPNARFGFILPHLWKNNLGEKTEDMYSDGVSRRMSQWQKTQCQKLNIPVFDPVEDTRMFIYNVSQYATNGTTITATKLDSSELTWHEMMRRELGTQQELYNSRYGTWYFQSQYVSDGGHPSERGSKMLSYFYENWMKTVLMSNY